MTATKALDRVLGEDFEFDLLTTEEQAEYLSLMTQVVGETWELTPKQLLAEAIWGKVDWLLFGGSAGGGKALRLDQVVPTPSGWTTIGDLRVGDLVLTEKGTTTAVVQLHPVHVATEVYRLTFDDGSNIEANGEHRWWTYTAADLGALTRRDPEWMAARRARRPSRSTGRRSSKFVETLSARNSARSATHEPAAVVGGVRTTREIAETLTLASGRTNHAIPVCDAYDGPEVALPVDPYVLGAWLGDGTSRSAILTCHDDDRAHMRQAFHDAGFVTTEQATPMTFGILGFKVKLVGLGVLGDKHVPEVYLRGSAKQRLALLQGLMDTDGCVCESGSVEFTNTNRRIAEAVVELACSLGHKARMTEGRATLYGKDCGAKYRVHWTPPDVVFRLERKFSRQKVSTRRTTRARFIVGCERVEPSLMRCITVANPTGMFLVGRSFIPTHNSELACHHVNRLSQSIPNHSSLIVRQSVPELRRSLILRLITRIKQYNIPARYRKLDGQSGFQFTNGSLIECGHCASDEDVGKYLSAEYGCMIIDEASQLTQSQVTALSARLRVTRAQKLLGARPHLGLFTNPGDVGHAWLYDLFVTPTGYGDKIVVYDVSQGIENAHPVREYEAPIRVDRATDVEIFDVLLPWARSLEIEADEQTQLAVGFVPSRATDNEHVDPSYMKFLNALPERRRRQLRDGDWDTFAGQFFAEFNRSIHIVAPFEIPDGWQRSRGIDYGSTAPYACLWGAWDNDGNCYIYREAYGAGMTPETQAKEVVSRSVTERLDGRPALKERYTATVADPSVFSDRRGTGKTIADMWRDHGLNVTRAKNQRVAGWANVRQYLWDPIKMQPRLFIFDTCPNLARTLPAMMRDRHTSEDLDTHLEDHACDALRYLLAVRPFGEIHRRKGFTAGADERFASMLRKLDKRKRPAWS